jgi:hypothetical protein
MKPLTIAQFLLINLLVLNVVFPQEQTVQIFLKNSTSINCQLKEVNNWGIIDSLNRSIVYNVIDSIIAINDTPLLKIEEKVENIQLRKRNDHYTLDLSKAILSKRQTYDFSPLVYRALYLNLLTERIAFLNLQLISSPWFSDKIISQFEFSYGNYSHNPEYSSFNFGCALGTALNFDNVNIFILLSWMKRYCFRSFQNGHNSYIPGNAYYFSLEMTKQIINDRYSFLIGINKSLSSTNFYNQNDKYIFKVGIGINLK